MQAKDEEGVDDEAVVVRVVEGVGVVGWVVDV